MSIESFPLPKGRTREALTTWTQALVSMLTRQRESGLWARAKRYTVATLPDPANAGAGMIIYVADETGGAVLAFSDDTNWRRVTDRAVVS